MPRKFVTGDAGKVSIGVGAASVIEVPCQGCGKPVEVTLPFFARVLCAECIEAERAEADGESAADAPEFKWRVGE